MNNLSIFGYLNAMKYSLKVPAIHMKSPMKYPGTRMKIPIESGREWIWNWQWNPQDTRMKNPLKAAGNRYEIDNEKFIERSRE